MTTKGLLSEGEWCVVATLLIAGMSYATLVATVPSWYSPFSFVVVIPAFLLMGVIPGTHVPVVLASFLVPAAFLLWSFPLACAQERIPLRSTILAGALVALSLVFLIASWPYGVRYQGVSHTVLMFGYSTSAWLGLALLAWKNMREPSFSSNLGFHLLLFGWLAWVAFPWLGELP